MSHDIHASWVASSIAKYLMNNPDACFVDGGVNQLSVFASKEQSAKWPLTDGIFQIEKSSNQNYSVALEFKRHNEGVHGLLTALGQAQAYLHKGYVGSIIVVPEAYSTLPNPGDYLKQVLDNTSQNQPIAVFTYRDADTSQASPYEGKIDIHRKLNLDIAKTINQSKQISKGKIQQWMHIREGSTVPSAFLTFLQIAKKLSFNNPEEPNIQLPKELSDAVVRIKPDANVLKYLSNATGENFLDVVWRNFWFNHLFTDEVKPLWKSVQNNIYEINDTASELLRADGSGNIIFFTGRKDSIKNELIEKLNNRQIGENHAWEEYAKNVRARAHSLREDIDSGLEHMGMLEGDGKPSDLGYKYLDAYERTGSPNSGTARRIFSAAIIQNGNLGAFLHYIHRLSEKKFSENPLEYTTRNGKLNFDQNSYLQWLEDELANNLRVLRKVSTRQGTPRKPFQAELAILSHLGFLADSKKRFRTGVGLVISWPTVQEAMSYPL
jgi:hypothetical protein